MNRQRLPDNIIIRETVDRAIRQIALEDKALAASIVHRIAELGLDPEPDNAECVSKLVQNLKRNKVYVRRLRCVDIKDYRIFYCVRGSGLICVYAVIFAKGAKHDEAYDETSHHYKLIKLLYSQYWKECL